MSASSFDRAAEIFEALETLPAAMRAAEARRLSSDDPEVLSFVIAMLAGEENSNGALDTPVAQLGEIDRATPLDSSTPVGPYTIVGLLGEGGMGVVYRKRASTTPRATWRSSCCAAVCCNRNCASVSRQERRVCSAR
ncbi:MAG: hypothetical protein R3E96_11505 [Planctomycetota bacterium]